MNPTSSSNNASTRAESQLDALIAKIHELSGGKTPPLAAETPRAEPVRSAAGPPVISSSHAVRQWNQNLETDELGSAATRNALPNAAQNSPEALSPLLKSALHSMPLAFQPTRDEPWRPAEPESLNQTGVKESTLEAIIFRFLLNIGECEGRAVADQVKLPFRIVEPLLTRFKMDQLVSYKASTATNDYVYVLTEAGRTLARGLSKDCSYFGACPVRLKDYVASVKAQTVEGQHPKRGDLERAFADLLINPRMLDKLGPAINSGRGMFLFGYPGNGKTSIAERVTSAFGKYIWIPRAVDIDGEIMRVYDP